MSVIVKGMEMPKYCYDCPLQDGETGICNILKMTVYDIPKECSLVEVIECKNCKHNPHNIIDDVCPFVDEDGYVKAFPNDDFFCKYGERREDKQIH